MQYSLRYSKSQLKKKKKNNHLEINELSAIMWNKLTSGEIVAQYLDGSYPEDRFQRSSTAMTIILKENC